ncbi:hypothetical protein [Roseimicrobium sp. ORNL1]|uniref:hypothetical protein n=1 Tax=Roseimicrobium sp. ORNL1 TaxID=2711231 RepID=UPI00197CE73D|nr:hypothetical protein [Roseimicrobium sp. ORNL1]
MSWRKEEGSYRASYRQHLAMIEWAVFINEQRREQPGCTLEEIIEMQGPFRIPSWARCRILTPEEQTGSRKGCAYVIECAGPNPFAVLSDGTVEVGPLLLNASAE